MEDSFIVNCFGYLAERLEALSPEHAAELYADMRQLADGEVVHVQDEGSFTIRLRTERYAVRRK